MTVDRRPASLGRGISAFAGSVALVTGGFYSWPALVLGAAGTLVLWAGLLRGTRSMVTTGAFGLFVAAMIAGAQAAPIVPVLASVVLTVVAWDAGSNAISVGEQLGRSADTTRIEAVHGAATLAVGTLTAAVGYAVYRFATGGQPVAAVAFLLLGAVLLVATLD
ncbi:MAG: hypothetical protein ABEH88_09515 [Halobacteriales archaeon]